MHVSSNSRWRDSSDCEEGRYDYDYESLGNTPLRTVSPESSFNNSYKSRPRPVRRGSSYEQFDDVFDDSSPSHYPPLPNRGLGSSFGREVRHHHRHGRGRGRRHRPLSRSHTPIGPTPPRQQPRLLYCILCGLVLWVFLWLLPIPAPVPTIATMYKQMQNTARLGTHRIEEVVNAVNERTTPVPVPTQEPRKENGVAPTQPTIGLSFTPLPSMSLSPLPSSPTPTSPSEAPPPPTPMPTPVPIEPPKSLEEHVADEIRAFYTSRGMPEKAAQAEVIVANSKGDPTKLLAAMQRKHGARGEEIRHLYQWAGVSLERRLTVGDRVVLSKGARQDGCLTDGMVGIIVEDAHDSQPYRVRSANNGLFWYREAELKPAPTEPPTNPPAPTPKPQPLGSGGRGRGRGGGGRGGGGNPKPLPEAQQDPHSGTLSVGQRVAATHDVRVGGAVVVQRGSPGEVLEIKGHNRWRVRFLGEFGLETPVVLVVGKEDIQPLRSA